MKLSNLRYFQAVSKHKNMTRAAEELHVSQPSLSHAIRELEDEFGIALFLRQNKGIVLTEEGQRFLNETNLLLEQADTFVKHMKQLGKANMTVKLGIPPASGALLFPDVLQALHHDYPQIKVQIFEIGSLGNRRSVLDGKVDVALVSTRAPISSAFGCYLLTCVDIHYYISVRNPLAAFERLTLEQTKDFPCVLLAEDCFLTSDILASYERIKTAPNVILNTNQLSIIRQLVENNVAGTFLFNGVLPPSDLYVEVPVQGLEPAQIYLIWNKSDPITPAKDKLMKAILSLYPPSSGTNK